MNRLFGPGLIIGAIAVVLILNVFLFTVGEREQAIVLRFGDPVRIAPDAGLKAKLPIENVVKLDKRNLEYDHSAQEIFTVNQERLVVDAFVRYQIIEPLRYYESFRAGGGDSQRALRAEGEKRLAAVLESALRAVLGEATDIEIIRDRRAQLMQAINALMAEEVRKFGVRIIDVKIRRADFPTENEDDVYQRMRSERQQIAQRIRAEGDEQKRRIEAQADRRETEILADANRRALEIKGRADAARNCIFAGAYDGVPVNITEETIDATVAGDDEAAPTEEGETPPTADERAAIAVAAGGVQTEANAAIIGCEFLPGGQRDPERAEFFAFYRSLDAYKVALQQGETTILLSPDSEFFRYFRNFEPPN